MRLTKHYFLHILFAIIAFWGITSYRVDAKAMYDGKQSKAVCVVQNDDSDNLVLERDLMPATNAAINPRGSQRIGGSRPTRLLPTNGGKHSRMFGKWLSSNPFTLSCATNLFLCRVALASKGRAASPRFYYVIALRRILC